MAHLWKNQVAMAMRVVPSIPSVAVRCASPDLSIRYDMKDLLIQTISPIHLTPIVSSNNVNVNSFINTSNYVQFIQH